MNKERELLWRDECPQQFTSEQVTTIKNAVKGRRGNVNITPYHIYDYDEHKVGEWRETIDGVKKCKPVYEKTYTISTTLNKGDWTSITLPNIASISKIIDCYVMNNDGLLLAIQVQKYSDRIEIYNTRTSYNFENANNLVLCYTKTTDEWEVVVE